MKTYALIILFSICSLSFSQNEIIMMANNDLAMLEYSSENYHISDLIKNQKEYPQANNIEPRLTIGKRALITGRYSSPLKIIAPSILNYRFASKVGGVSFQQTLNSVEDVSIRYVSENEDGKRLEIKINEKKHYPFIPDWQLIPIAKFASTPYNAAISAFGLENNFEEPFVYHKAFQNTLLGLRLFQADIILTNPKELYELPKYGGETILGKGESVPSIEFDDLESLWSFLRRYSLGDNSYTSYILTDNDIEISLNEELINESLYQDEKPYYHFWKQQNVWDPLTKKKIDSLNNKYIDNLKLFDIFNKQRIIEKEIFDSTDYYESIVLTLDELNLSYKNESLKILNEGEKVAVKAEVVTSYMNLLYYPLLEQINPPVFNAVQNTMNYSALFRHIKKE